MTDLAAPARRTAPDRLLRGRGTTELFRELRKSGDRRVRNELVERHLHLIEPLCRRFARRGYDIEDLRQAAFVALIGAVERFDPEVGVDFSHFAHTSVHGQLKRHVRDTTWAIRPPRRVQEDFLEVVEADERLWKRLGRRPTVDEIALELDLPADRVITAIEAGAHRRSAPLDPDWMGGGPSRVDGRLDQVEVWLALRPLLSRLDERELEAITLVFYEGCSQHVAADRLGVSQSYLSRLVRRTLARLREELEST